VSGRIEGTQKLAPALWHRNVPIVPPYAFMAVRQDRHPIRWRNVMPNINVKWVSVVVLSVALSTAAFAAGRGGGGHGGGGHGGGGHGGGGRGGGAHFSGGHGGGGHGGGARFAGGGRHFSGRAAVSRSAGGGHVRGNNAATDHAATEHNATGNLSHANAGAHTNAIHHALAGAAIAGALHNHNALNNPASRAHISAAAATAGWQGHGRHGGWWRHANGGYGWVGPLFWPFAYYDLYGYAMWGSDPSLWDYGYGDIYAGIFAPYGYDDLSGYLPSGSAASSSGGAAPPNQPNALAQMCGEDSQEIAGLPVDRIQQALNPNDEQRKALDDLANASVQAAQTIKAACPAQVVSTAPARLAAMQTRLEAMISAVNTVQPPLDHFYGLLNDEQKARLTALGEDQRRGRQNEGVLAQGCGQGQAQASATDWPAAEIDQRLHPTDAQRASLDNLKDASAKAADMLKGTCEPNETLTPPARLSAAGKRLDAMLQAVETVKSALDDVYAELNDEQKAQFESIGPARDAAQTSASDDTAQPSRHHHRHASVVGLVRRLIGF
jgi:hypothetical protein